MSPFTIALIFLVVGISLGYFIRAVLFLLKKNSLELTIHERIMKAREHAQAILSEAQEKVENELELLRQKEREKEQDFKQIEERLLRKEELLDARHIELTQKTDSLVERAEALASAEKETEEIRSEAQRLLESTAGMDAETALITLLQKIEREYSEDLATRTMKLSLENEEAFKAEAKNILASVIQRLAVPTTNELTTATITLQNEEVKGKIIGKEGRNIRAFERASGVELLIDESPNTIVVSSFDPVRRAVAVTALESLIKDGRIQPAKIEEEIETAKQKINDVIKEKGAQAVLECGVVNFDPRLIAILGRLHFRTSYGQNVLQHSIEMAHIADMLAKEIGADAYTARAGALVHDIGKALDHEFEGSHVDIGIRVLRKFNTDERIISAMKSHHDDCPHESVESVIVQVADMISGARPGARRDNAEMYVKRLQELEKVAARFTGVEKVYALQAGREVRVFVEPSVISDFEARNLGRSIALSIEQELRYPGEIKVTIIRETRVIDFAR